MVEYEEIIDRLIDEIPETQDTRESTVTYQILAAAAVEIKNAYDLNDVTNIETFADTATLEGLTKRAKERGISHKKASNAIVKGVFNIPVPIGSRFFQNDFSYVVTEEIDETSYKMECEQPGIEGNYYIGSIIPIQDIENLTSAEVTEILIPGEDEQSTEDFRKVYFDSFNNNSYGWNKAMYKTYVNDIQGVGGVLVLPHTNGNMETQGGHVGLVIESSTYGVPAQSLLDNIKQILDPTDGNGDGVVSIDHCVHCFACGKTVVNVESTITYESGYSYETLKTQIEKAIDDYFLTLNKEWQEEQIVVRIAKLESALIGIKGILDVSGTKLNGMETSITINRNNIVERGVISG